MYFFCDNRSIENLCKQFYVDICYDNYPKTIKLLLTFLLDMSTLNINAYKRKTSLFGLGIDIEVTFPEEQKEMVYISTFQTCDRGRYECQGSCCIFVSVFFCGIVVFKEIILLLVLLLLKLKVEK